MKEVKAYQCSYCTFYRKTKSSVIGHESRCFKNPKNKACASCNYNEIDYNTVYNRHHNGDPGSTDYEASCNWCSKKEILLNSNNLTYNCPFHSKKD